MIIKIMTMKHLVCTCVCVTLWVSTSGLVSRRCGSAPEPYPSYMHLYQTLLDSDGGKVPEPSLHHSDSVISLFAQICHQVDDKWAVTFDMSSISTSDDLQHSELRLRFPASSTYKRLVLNIYHAPQGTEEHLYLGRIAAKQSMFPSSHSSWRVLNITQLLKDWLHQGSLAPPQVQSDEGASQDHENTTQILTANSVIMVVYFKQMKTEASTLIHTYMAQDQVPSGPEAQRHKRSDQDNRTVSEFAEGSANSQVTQAVGDKTLCRKVDMWVNFDQIKWDKWLVYPKRYNLYRCEGDCPTPVNKSFMPTNHSYMQSLLKMHHPDRVPCPSCVPTRLAPLSMLYYKDRKISALHVKDMVAKACGCH